MKKIFLSFILLAASCGAAFAGEDPLSLFRQGNQAYESGRYAEAVTTYESLLGQGQANAALYYNLGNAYYRGGRIGKALLSYERAARLAPRDGDIRSNLSFLRLSVKEPPLSFFSALLAGANSLLSLNELTALCSVFFLLLVAGIAGWLFNRRQVLLAADLLLGVIFLSFAGWLAVKINDENVTRHAVVIAGPADVRNGPGMENSVGFTLPEGRAVIILGETNDWEAVGLPAEGLRGWIEKKYVEEI